MKQHKANSPNHSVRTRAGKDIVCEIFIPDNYNQKLLIVCSGMPGSPSSPKKYKKLISLGYGIITFRYRGSWESGGIFLKSSPYDDLKIVIDQFSKGFVDLWTQKKLKVTYKELVVIGSSFGGPAAIFASAHPKVNRVIISCGLVDWQATDQTDEPFDHMRRFVRDGFGMGYRIDKKGWDKLETGNFYNPVTSKLPIKTDKMMFIHALDDTIVHYDTVKKYCDARKLKLITIKQGGHASGEYLNRSSVLKKVNLI